MEQPNSQVIICAGGSGVRGERWAPGILIAGEMRQSACNASLHAVREYRNLTAGNGNLCLSTQAFPDNAARREVEALAAVCPNEECTWMGTIKEFEVHADAKQAGKWSPGGGCWICLLHQAIIGTVVCCVCVHVFFRAVMSNSTDDVHPSKFDLIDISLTVGGLSLVYTPA